MLKTDIYKMSKEKKVKFGRRSGYIFNIQNFKAALVSYLFRKIVFLCCKNFTSNGFFFHGNVSILKNFAPQKLHAFFPSQKRYSRFLCCGEFYFLWNNLFGLLERNALGRGHSGW